MKYYLTMLTPPQTISLNLLHSALFDPFCRQGSWPLGVAKRSEFALGVAPNFCTKLQREVSGIQHVVNQHRSKEDAVVHTLVSTSIDNEAASVFPNLHTSLSNVSKQISSEAPGDA